MKDNVLHIYIARFFSSFNLFVFVPFYPVWLAQEKLLSPLNISIVTALVIISLRSASLIFANAIKKFHKKQAAVLSLILSTITYLIIFILAVLHIQNIFLWYLLSLILGALIAIASLVLLAAIALNIKESAHLRGFSYMNIALNLSSGVGSLIGALIIHYNLRYLPLAPVFFSLVAIYFALNIPRDPIVSIAQVENNQRKLNKKPYILLTLASFFTFIAYAQFYDVLPIYANHTIGARMVGILYLVSAIVIVLLQTSFTALLKKLAHPLIVVIGNILFAMGIFLLLFSGQNILYLSFLGVIILSIGEIAWLPTYQTMAIQLYPKNNPVLALAIMMTAWGVGESLATFFGVYTSMNHTGYSSYILGAICALIAALISYRIFRLKISTVESP